VQYVALNKGGVAGEPNDIAVLIDRRRGVPPLSPKLPMSVTSTVFPKHRVLAVFFNA